MSRTWKRHVLIAILSGVVLPGGGIPSSAQGPSPARTIEDDESFIRGLIEQGLVERLDQFLDGVQREDVVRAASLRIAAERMRMEGAAGNPTRRGMHIERILELRRTLIDSHPGHPRRAVWMADQAQDCLEYLLTVDASGITMLLGYPTPRQQDIARRAAQEMFESATDAENEIGTTILEIEIHPDYQDDTALQLEHRRLVEEERDGRIAYLRGIGAFLHAEFNEDDPQKRETLHRMAIARLEPLAERLGGTVAVRSALYAGLAQGRLGHDEPSNAHLEAVIRDGQSHAFDGFAARMGQVFNQQRQGGAEAALKALDDLQTRYESAEGFFFLVLIADRRFLLSRQLSETDESFSRGQAFDAYLDLLKLPLGVAADQVRSIVFARLVNAAEDGTPLEDLPALVTVARAAHLARDSSGQDEAVLLLEGMLQSGRLDQNEIPLVLFELGKILHASDRRLQAVHRFTELARDHPKYPQAERAIELAVSMAETLQRLDSKSPEFGKALRAACDVLLNGYPNLSTIDRWRYIAGRLAMSERRYDQAISLFQQVSPDASQWTDSLFMQAAAARARGVRERGESDTSPKAVQLQHAVDVIRNVRPSLHNEWAGEKDASRRRDLGYYLGLLDVFEAEALLGLGHPQPAIDVIKRLEDVPDLEATVIAEALRVRIGAEQLAGRPEEAGRQLKRFLQTAPDQVEAVTGPMLNSLLATVDSLLESSGEAEARSYARSVLLPVAETLQPWLDDQEPGEPVEVRLRVADAYRVAGEFVRARHLYEQLLLRDPRGLQVLFGQAECLFGLGSEANLSEAMKTYRRIAAAGPGTTEARRVYYWSAQLRMLQILDRTGHNTDKIAPRIRQLRQLDRDLGGVRFRRAFERLHNRHS